MRFCRYCGVPIPQDSHFCPQCGKRLGRRPYPRFDRAVSLLKLNTPYPYFLLLILAGIAWMATNRSPAFDYSQLDWNIELSARTGPDDEGLYRQTVWLIAENRGTAPVKDIPVDLRVVADPANSAEITTRFKGRQFTLSEAGKPKPLTVILSDPIQAGTKRRYLFEGTVKAEPPFTVIYEFRDESRTKMLARYATEP
jgi:hypothetical protein